MRLLTVLSSSSAAFVLAGLVACSSNTDSVPQGLGGGGSSATDDDSKGSGSAAGGADGMGGSTSSDPAPGTLDVELTVDEEQHTFSWTLPEDDDLASLRFLVLPASDPEPELEDADKADLEDESIMIANLKTGTQYVAYFFLSDEAGQSSMTKLPFKTAGPAPVSDIFALPLRGAVYFRWQEPAPGVESVVIRQGDEFVPSSTSEGELVHSELSSRFLQQSLSPETEYGYLFYTVDADEKNSNFEFAQLTTVDEFKVVNDAVSDCDSYGFKVYSDAWTQTFVRGDIGEDVLVGIELQISKNGTPADNLRVEVRDENDDYLWSSSITEDKIPSGTSWIRLSADGLGIKGVPYELLDPGQTYTIAVWTNTVDDGGSYTWKSSIKGNDCYPAGEGTAGRDFHFRTLHPAAE